MTSEHGFTRRAALRSGGGLVAGLGLTALLGVPASASPGRSPSTEPVNPAALVGRPSANGWAMEYGADIGGSVWTRPVQGTPLTVAVRIPDVEVVLLHVIRRFHYEIDALRAGDVVGHRPVTRSLTGRETNHASGTAIDIRPGWYPPGVAGGFFPHELAVIRDILTDCEGTVVWGGDFRTPHEAHFEIAARPTGDQLLTTVNPHTAKSISPPNAQLATVAQKIRRWNATPGAGAGS